MASTIRHELVLAMIIVIAVIAGSSWCGCSGGVVEGFRSAVNLQGAALGYCMNVGVPKAEGMYVPPPGVWGDNTSPFAKLAGNKAGAVPPSKMFMFEKNRFDPSCCSSPYSDSMGCVCLSEQQAEYLNERGGNRTSGYF